MVFCNDCMYCHELRTAHEYFCSNFCCYFGALGCDEGKQKPQTNADRIRGMSDEELADWYFDKFFPCVPYCSMLQDGCPEHDDCKICLLDWLRKEAKQ